MRKRSLNHTLFDWHFIGFGLFGIAVLHFAAVVALSICFAYDGQWQWVLCTWFFIYLTCMFPFNSVYLLQRLCAKLNDWLDILITNTTKATKGWTETKKNLHTTKQRKRSVEEWPRSRAFSQTNAFKYIVLWTTSTENYIKKPLVIQTHIYMEMVLYLSSVLEPQM